jgi:hypothetical protein
MCQPEEVWSIAKARLGPKWSFMWDPGCTEEEMDACEERLGVKLPTRVRELMAVCSGCGFPRAKDDHDFMTFAMEHVLRPVGEWLSASQAGFEMVDFNALQTCDDEVDEDDEGPIEDHTARAIVVGTSISEGSETST